MGAQAPEGLLIVAGAAPDTANLGVSALCYATLAGLREHCPDAPLGVLDGGNGIRRDRFLIGDAEIEVYRIGLRIGRRYDLVSNASRVRWSLRHPAIPNPIARAFRSARAVLDISGGDSFTDLYGPKRFHSVVTTKRLALEAGCPLILLPQTYGPFRDPECKAIASDLCRRATAAWARDSRSFAILKDLLGDSFDPERHHDGVDVAFLLPERDPGAALPQSIRTLLDERPRSIAGLNISGLIYNDPESARTRYGFRADYNALCLQLVEALVADGADVLLIPHVGSRRTSVESDPSANEHLLSRLSPTARSRVHAVPFLNDPQAAKWVIARVDWFCGMRMHATIAGLSSGVPTAAISYSPKTIGVFEACGVGDAVQDPTRNAEAILLSKVIQAFRSRDPSASRGRQSIQLKSTAASLTPKLMLTLAKQPPTAVGNSRSDRRFQAIAP